MGKKLSVLVITYNQEKFISHTLDSIINQEHKYDYEIVIGDDNSSDNTSRICREYAEKYPKIIKYIFNDPNLGVIKNYFNVLNNCTGEYIMECAGDDWWLPGKVKKQIEFLDLNPDVGMCYGYARQFLDSTGKFAKERFGSEKITFDQLIDANDIPAPSVCFRRELALKYIAEVEPFEKKWIMEDYPMWIWFSYNSRIVFLQKDFAVYRVFEESVSHSKSIEKYLKVFNCYAEIQNFFLEKRNLPLKSYDMNEISGIFYARHNNRKSAADCFSRIENKSTKIKIYSVIVKNPLLYKIFCLWG